MNNLKDILREYHQLIFKANKIELS